MKSIIQTEKECFFCRTTYGLHVHHCLHGTANRKLADQDGLTVYLCYQCHTNLHDKGVGDEELQRIAEEAWIASKGYSREQGITEFIKRYGKNHI